MSCQARQGKEAYQMAILTISNREAEGAGETVGGGEADVALAGEEAGDDDLGDAGFLADLIDRLGACWRSYGRLTKLAADGFRPAERLLEHPVHVQSDQGIELVTELLGKLAFAVELQ